MAESAIITRVFTQVQEIPSQPWNTLLARQPVPTPFMRHEYLAALEASGSATLETGWQPCFVTLWQGDELVAACPLYAKNHSSGEYVFDWAWARAYAEHGLEYYPKAVIAVPFTPVPGSRLLARDAPLRALLAQTVRRWIQAQDGWSSVHVLFTEEADLAACRADGWMQRGGVQFHWHNRAAQGSRALRDFDDFLAQLQQEKRKKIRQERRKVAEAGVTFRVLHGAQITSADWDFFYGCYARTYYEHGNPPYLSRDFFTRMGAQMAAHWLLFIAERDGQPMAASLIALDAAAAPAGAPADAPHGVAYGRYWGALERVDCLHFEACYYQPIEWCIANGIARFEGGAQGEHKMARALLPTPTASAHWIAHPAFADAVDRFLAREGTGVQAYLEELHAHSPLRAPAQAPLNPA